MSITPCPFAPRARFALLGLWALLWSLGSSPRVVADDRAVTPLPDLTAYIDATPRCDLAAATRCFGVRLFIAQEAGVPVQTPDWVAAQVREANARLALISVHVEVTEVALLTDAEASMTTRSDRDALGRARHRAGTIQVYVVRRLADVDILGNEIYGVHWRDRADNSRRWIILSSIAWPLTFAHELGHYFDLQHHRRHPKSIMHEDRATWPASDLTYAPKELPTMRKALARMLKDRTLAPLSPPPAPDTP
jgi:limonene-1,2-epoxide hydrolase